MQLIAGLRQDPRLHICCYPTAKGTTHSIECQTPNTTKGQTTPWNKNRSSAKLATSVFMRLKSSTLCSQADQTQIAELQLEWSSNEAVVSLWDRQPHCPTCWSLTMLSSQVVWGAKPTFILLFWMNTNGSGLSLPPN